MARRHTPYYHKLVALGAELVDRIGYDAGLPLHDRSPRSIWRHASASACTTSTTRAPSTSRAPTRSRSCRHLLVNDPTRIDDGGVLYSSLCNEAGGMVDDLTVYRLAGDHYWLCPTPSRVDVVGGLDPRPHGRPARVPHEHRVRDGVPVVAGPAIARDAGGDDGRGPVHGGPAVLPLHARRRRRGAGPDRPDRLFGRAGIRAVLPARIRGARLGRGVRGWARHSGSRRAGSGALRSVRMEKKYPLYGLDLNETTSPLEAVPRLDGALRPR